MAVTLYYGGKIKVETQVDAPVQSSLAQTEERGHSARSPETGRHREHYGGPGQFRDFPVIQHLFPTHPRWFRK